MLLLLFFLPMMIYSKSCLVIWAKVWSQIKSQLWFQQAAHDTDEPKQRMIFFWGKKNEKLWFFLGKKKTSKNLPYNLYCCFLFLPNIRICVRHLMNPMFNRSISQQPYVTFSF